MLFYLLNKGKDLTSEVYGFRENISKKRGCRLTDLQIDRFACLQIVCNLCF
jgi:hypothetical protein